MQHPRNAGRDWLRAIPGASYAAALGAPVQVVPMRRGAAIDRVLVPTSDETRRLFGVTTHRMTHAETEAWTRGDDDVRRAIREAIREDGGGELFDDRGRLIERIA